MDNRNGNRAHILVAVPCLLMMLTGLLTSVCRAESGLEARDGWKVEQGVKPPSYAIIIPTRTDLNVDSVVLSCDGTDRRMALRLEVYFSTDDPQIRVGAAPAQLKDRPNARIVVDKHFFPVTTFFADDYIVLADDQEGAFPILSEQLLDAMAAGKTMIIHFDLTADHSARSGDIGGEVVIDLQAGAGGAAVAAVRRCAGKIDRLVGSRAH